MAVSSKGFILLLVALFLITTSSPVAGGGMESWMPIGGGEEEFGMESEISRRVLQQANRYISYGALQRNTVPCSKRGASYYNCQNGGQANPYQRGCSAITRCRS
ncbi:Protein RALF-like 33 [Linum perenne]